MPKFLRVLLIVTLLSLLSQLSLVFANELRGGRIVWWGQDSFWKNSYSSQTNGVIENEDEIVEDIVAIAARQWQGFALRKDGTVFEFGRGFSEQSSLPSGLTNVASISMEGNSCWAIKRDGTAAQWGGDEDHARIVPMLTNVSSIAWVGYRSYLALKTDGTLIGLRFDIYSPHIDPATGLPIPVQEADAAPVKVNRQILSNITAATFLGNSPIILQGDGMVFSLEGKPFAGYEVFAMPPFQYETKRPIEIDGSSLRNVSAIAGSGTHMLAVRSNGTVVAWGNNQSGQCNVPTDLNNVVAVVAVEHRSLALKRDGTVVAWGGNFHGETSVPAGLSNVVAIAAGGFFSLAVTTGAIPVSVYVRPHGRLEELEREADFIFKGQVISSKPATNDSFPDWGKPHATQLKVISVLKGSVATNAPIIWHNTSGPMAWGGSRPPSDHQFVAGQCYLVFAVGLGKAAYCYSPPPDATNRPGEFRQTYNDGVTLTLDDRAVKINDMKAAHWAEFELLLKGLDATNQIYAIERLDALSYAGRPDDEWARAADFKRAAVLNVLLPLTTNIDQQVAVRAIKCFAVETNGIAHLKSFTGALVDIANNGASARRRLESIYSLSGLCADAVTNSLQRLLEDQDENIRAGAVRLLPRFTSGYTEQALRERADDKSPIVRAVVADVIGEENYVQFLPLLVKLFSDPIGKNPLIEPLTMEMLKAGNRWNNNGDVHTSAGFALLKFELVQTRAILETNLSDEGFSMSFMKKLAPDGAESFMPALANELKSRAAASEKEAGKIGFHWGLSHLLEGNYGWAWDTLFNYVSSQSRQTLATQRILTLLDALQIADDPGDIRTRTLYEFYLDRGMTELAVALRLGMKRRTEDKAIDRQSFNFPGKLKVFDEIDEKHSLKPGLGIQFNLP